jgi:hypothetical protein
MEENNKNTMKIDVEKIQNQVNREIWAEQKYSRENQAKLRAIEQRVPTYDDFRQIVLASHLKPLDKGESLTNNATRSNIVWNSAAGGASTLPEPVDLNLNASQEQQAKEELIRIKPRTNLEFVKIWKRLDDSSELKWEFVKNLGEPYLYQLFSVEINGEILGEFLRLFQTRLNSLSQIDLEFVFSLLKCFTKCKRFELNKMFLKPVESDACRSILDKFEESIQTILIEEQDLKDLKNAYFK